VGTIGTGRALILKGAINLPSFDAEDALSKQAYNANWLKLASFFTLVLAGHLSS
jgi:hypothetical protein